MEEENHTNSPRKNKNIRESSENIHSGTEFPGKSEGIPNNKRQRLSGDVHNERFQTGFRKSQPRVDRVRRKLFQDVDGELTSGSGGRAPREDGRNRGFDSEGSSSGGRIHRGIFYIHYPQKINEKFPTEKKQR